MPDLSNLLLPIIPHFEPNCSTPSSSFLPDADAAIAGVECEWKRGLRFPISTRRRNGVLRKERRAGGRRSAAGDSLEEFVQAWMKRKLDGGVREKDCVLPFLKKDLKMVQCRLCKKFVSQGDEVLCSVQLCRHAYHRTCINLKEGSSKHFKCPQHACFNCNRKNHWHCVRCFISFHVKCSPWPDDVVFLANRPGRAICWRHPSDWHLDKQHADPTSDLEEVFHRLPLPYIDEEFEIGSIVNDVLENITEPAPYIHIKRNVYLVKRKRVGADANVGCTNCNANSDCSENCECRGLSLSCTKACHCSEMCTNKPFRKEKKIKVVKTNLCGWGAVALETIEKGRFVVEYVGEVIDDALCEQRLWDMKRRGDQNFYMCEIQKDFTIDATFKGNFSRFLNHSCDPNCK
ncbi:histone-lysine N-methyltransferase ASHR3 isoform X2 [Phalaenopsis equestris]|nr:histone-lysine N-methyltransferase ASHR3 isoform X2 [Phalaenopsis equestris]